MVNIVNYGTLGGGFRHYAGLQPLTPASGDPQSRASVRNFHLDPTNAAAIFRGDIITYADSTHGVQGGGDQPYNLSAPSNSPVIGGGGGTGLGNASMTPNAARWVPGDTTSVIVGACVGFGSITLYQAKNSFQYVPASTEAWLSVETDKSMEYAITVPTVPNTAFNLRLGEGADVQANAGNQSTRFGISGVSLDPALATTSTLPLRVLNSGEFIGNDPTAAGFVAKVQFNSTRMTGFVAD
jgi:hypothetical protein